MSTVRGRLTMLTKQQPIKSSKILHHAKGQPCCLRFDCCNNNPETTVACHIRDRHKGTGNKASDISVIFGCSACHAHLDESGGWKSDVAYFAPYVIRGLQETWEILIREGIIFVPRDRPKQRKTKPRKPKSERKKWASRPMRRQPSTTK